MARYHPSGLKRCSRCLERKPWSRFSPHQSHCKPCKAEWARAYFAAKGHPYRPYKRKTGPRKPRHYPLTANQRILIKYIHEHPRCSVEEISRFRGVTLQAVWAALIRLERRSLVSHVRGHYRDWLATEKGVLEALVTCDAAANRPSSESAESE